ncbi:MAG TPA: hypothetical protein VLH09_13990 [Bryobacteraceae bacterium]|nr:hypothetical protein [Bryobacteraceae bacterium]
MRRKETAQQATRSQCDCLCMGMGPKLTEMLQCRSEAAAGHLRSARIEFLKAMRALIDERIEHLARAQKKKGAAVTVE